MLLRSQAWSNHTHFSKEMLSPEQKSFPQQKRKNYSSLARQRKSARTRANKHAYLIFIFSPNPDLSPTRVHAESDFISEAQKRMQSLVKTAHQREVFNQQKKRRRGKGGGRGEGVPMYLSNVFLQNKNQFNKFSTKNSQGQHLWYCCVQIPRKRNSTVR